LNNFLKENFRGFNQSVEIGKAISKKMSWNFFPDLLVRKRLASPQTKLKEEERKENIRGVFAINSNYRSLIADHSSLILFDDVYTTGATLKEACKVLKGNGAGVVWGLTIAR
jgi:predicted amidophosphoribosyltransferase